MHTSDAPSRLQKQHQPQDQVLQSTDAQGQSEARLARTLECDAPQSSCPMSRSHSGSPSVVAPCRRTRSQSVRWGHASSLRNVHWYGRSIWSENGLVSLFGKKAYDWRSPTTSQLKDRSVSWSPNNTLTEKSRAAAAPAGKPSVERCGNQWNQSPTTWNSRTSGCRILGGASRVDGALHLDARGS